MGGCFKPFAFIIETLFAVTPAIQQAALRGPLKSKNFIFIRRRLQHDHVRMMITYQIIAEMRVGLHLA
jgi:hypothetical protein